MIDIDEALRMSEYHIPPPPEIDDEQRSALLKSSFSRIWDSRDELAPPGDSQLLQPGQGASPQDLSMLLLVRMATRIAQSGDEQNEHEVQTEDEKPMEVDSVSKQERIRQALFDYVMTDFQSRSVHEPSQFQPADHNTQRKIGCFVDERGMVQ